MPVIPIYRQQVLPGGVPSSGSISPAAASAVSGAVAQGGAALGQVGMQQARQLEQERLQAERAELEQTRQYEALKRQRIEAEAQVQAAKLASQWDLDQSERFAEMRRTAPPGAPEFTESYLGQYDQSSQKLLEGIVNESTKQRLQLHLLNSREQFGKTAVAFQNTERTRQMGRDVDEGVNAAATLVYGNPAWFEREMGQWGSMIANMPLEAADKDRLREVARKRLVNSAVLSFIEKNPREALTIMQNMQGADTMAEVQWQSEGQPYKVPINMGTAEERLRWKDLAEREVEKQRQGLSVTLQYEVQNAEAMAATGTPPAGPAISRESFMSAYKDPVVAEHNYNRYVIARQTAVEHDRLKNVPSSDLLTLLQRRPDATDPNFATQVRNQEIVSSAAVRILQARTQDPVGYALQNNNQFGIQPLDPSNSEAFVEQLRRRAAALPEMGQMYGKAAILSKPETAALTQRLDALPAEQRVSQLTTIRSAISDDLVYMQTLNAIRPDSPVTALVGNIGMINSKNALLIAQGEDMLNPTKASKQADGRGAYPMPQDSLMRGEWVKRVGDAYRGYPDAESTAYQAYRAYYAAAAAKKGIFDPKASPDSRIVDEAIIAATGGVTRWKTDWFGNDTPSADIVLPYGMSPEDFRPRIEAEWLRTRRTLGYNKTDIGDLGLFNTGANGEYMLMSGQSWLPGPDGRPVILKITPNTSPVFVQPAPDTPEEPAIARVPRPAGPTPMMPVTPEQYEAYRRQQLEQRGR